MEGDNGSVGAHARVAAILQSLEDSGLVLTMAPASRDRADMRHPSPMRRHEMKPVVPKYSVETNTDVHRSNTSRGAQICDDRYISCYQVAHCRARPSSPPVTLSEFPPQRARPDHVEGNFEIGGVGSCEHRDTRTRSQRERRSCDRAVTNGIIPSCETDPFALSLRQYPSCPPLRTVSSELLTRKYGSRPTKTSSDRLREKILRRVQGKSSPLQNTQRTHSSWSFRKTKPSSRLRWNRSRHLMTHTYRFDSPKCRRPEKPCAFKREADASPTREKNVETGTQRNEAQQKSDISTTYDYLKSSRLSPTLQRRCERRVRIEEVGKQVRSAIRQMCQQRTTAFPICPEIKKRFEDHKKNRCTVNVSPTRNQQRASSTGQGWFRDIMDCLVPAHPACEFYDRSISNLEEEICSKFCDQESQYPAPSENICDEVNEWLLEIPISKGESLADKRRREELASSLIVTLETMLILCDDDFEQNARNVIEKCVFKMPMWYSGTEKEKNHFKNQLVNNLLKRVLPKLDSRLRDIVKDFVDSLNFTEEVCPNVVIDDIVKKLENFADNVPKDDKEFKETLIKEIEDILNKLPIKLFGKRNMAINTTANHLAIEVTNILKTMSLDSPSKTNKRSRTSSAPCRRVDSQSSSSHTIGCQYEHVLTDKRECICLTKSSNKLFRPYCSCASYRKEVRPCDCDCECDEDYYDQRIDDAIADWLTNIPVPVNESHEDPLIREHLAKELGETLKNLSLDDDNVMDVAREEIANCVHMMPMWNPGNRQDKAQLKQQLVNQLLSKIRSIFLSRLKEGNKEFRMGDEAGEYKNQIKEEMMGDLERILNETPLLQYEKDDLINKLDYLINNALAQGKSIAIRSMMDKGIAKLIPSSSIPRDEQQSIIDKMKDVVKTKTEELQSAKDKQKNVLNDMIDSIDSRNDLNREQKINLTNKMANLVAALDKQLMSEDQIKDKMHRIFDETDISEKIKSDFKDKLEKMLPNLQEQKNKAKASILREIVDVIDKTNMPQELISQLKDDIACVLTDHFKKPITRNMLKDVKESLCKILSDIPIPTKDKQAIKLKLGNILEKNIEPLLSDSGYEPNKILNDITAAIDLQDDLNDNQKGILKNKLNDLAAVLSGQPITEYQIRDKINRIIDETDIPKDIKQNLKDNIENMLPELQERKNKARSNIFRDAKAVIEDTNLPREIKKKLKEQIETLVTDSFKKSVTPVTLKDVKESLRKIINDTPISTKDKREIEQKLEKIMEQNIQPIIFDSGSDQNKIISDITAAIDLQDDLDEDQKVILKNKLNDLAFDLDGQSMSENQIRDEVNRIIDENDIPKDIKRNLKDNIENMLPKLQERKNKVKGLILSEANSIIEDTKLPREIKNKLREQFEKLLFDNFKRSVTPVTLKDVRESLRKIINDAPISTREKREIEQKLGNIVEKNIEPLISYSGYKPNKILGDITAAIDLQHELDEDQKMVLKNKLKDLAADLDGEFITEDQIRDEVNTIIDEIDVPKEIKGNLKDNIERFLPKLQERKNKAKINTLRDINSAIENTNLPRETKRKLKGEIEKMLTDNIKRSVTPMTLKDVKESLRKILNNAPISPKDRKEIEQTVGKIIRENIEPLLSDSGHEPSKIVRDITATIDLQDDLNENHKKILKNKLKDLAADLDEQFMTEDQIRDKVRRIVDDTDIPKDIKRDLKDNIESMLPKLQVRKNRAKSNILRDINSVIENTNLPGEIKNKLKEKIESIVTDNLKKSVTPTTLKEVKKSLRKILNDAPISTKDKKEIEHNLSRIMDKNVEPLISDSALEQSKILHDVTAAINLHDDLNEDQKLTLKNKLKKLAIDLDDQFFTEDQIRDKVHKILDETDLPKDIKADIKDNIESMLPKLQGKKNKAKNNILNDINSVIDDTDLPREIKKKLKNEIESIVTDNFEKSVTPMTLKNVNDSLREILSDTPIATKDKKELEKKLGRLVEKHLEPLIADSKGHRTNMLNDFIKEIDLRKDLDINQKRVLKNELENLAGSLENELMTHDELTEKMNEILDTTEMPASIRHNLKNKMEEYLVSRGKRNLQESELRESPTTQFKKMKAKDNILREVMSNIDKTSIPKKVKIELRNDIENLLNENFSKPLTPNTLKDLYEGISKIVNDTSFLKKEKNELEQVLGKIMQKNINPLIADNSHQANEMLSNITAAFDLLGGLNEDKKRELKRKLANLPLSVDGQFLTEDQIKDKVNEIIHEIDISEPLKRRLKNEVKSMVLETKKNNAKNNILRDINLTVEDIDVPEETKEKLMDDIENLLHENFGKPITPNTLKYMRDGLQKILRSAPISKTDKIDLVQKLDEFMVNNMKSLLADSKDEQNKILNEVITAIDLRKDLDVDQKRILKQNIDDLSASTERQFLTQDELKNQLYDIIEKSDISETVKRKLKNDVKNKAKTNKAKDNILRDIDYIIDSTNISDVIKDKIKYDIEHLINDNFNKPITPNLLKDVKNELQDVLQDAPIPKKDKKELENKLGDLMAKNIKPLIADNRGDRNKMLKDIIKEIELQKDLHDDQKKVLKTDLTELATELDEQFITDDELKEKMNQILDATDIPESIKRNLKNKVETMVSNYTSQENAFGESSTIKAKKVKIKENILRDVNAIIGKANLPSEIKQKLNDEIGNLVSENFNIPLTSSTLKNTIDGISKIINDASIPEKDKNELHEKLGKVMEKKIVPLIAEIGREPKKVLNNIIAAIDLQDDLDDNEKRVVKNVLSDLADTLEGQNLTPEEIRDEVNKTLNKTDIPEDIRRKLKKQINNIVSKLKTPQQAKMEVAKNNMLRDISSIIDDSNLSKEIKDYLKDEIESKLTDHFNEPITPETFKDIKEDLQQILKNAPISTNERNDLEQTLKNVMDKTLDPLIADSRGDRAKMLNDIIKGIDLRDDLDAEHKTIIKNDLTDLVTLLEEQFMTDEELQEEVNKIIDSTDIPEDIKNNLKNELRHTLMTKSDIKEIRPLISESSRRSSSAFGPKAYKCNINPTRRSSRNIKERMGLNLQNLSSNSTRKPIKLDAKTRNSIFRSIDIIVDMLEIPCYNKLFVSDMLKAVTDLDACPDVKKKCVDVILEYIELPAAKEAELRAILHGLFDECPCIVATYSRLGTSSYKPSNCYTQTLYHYPALYAFKKKIFNFATNCRAQNTSSYQSNENVKSVFNYDQAVSKCESFDSKHLDVDEQPILNGKKERAKRNMGEITDEYINDNGCDNIMNVKENINKIIDSNLPMSREKKANLKKKLGDIILEYARINTAQEIRSNQIYHASLTKRDIGRDKRKPATKGKNTKTRRNKDDSNSPNKTYSNRGHSTDWTNYDTDVYDDDVQDLDLRAKASTSMVLSSGRKKSDAKKRKDSTDFTQAKDSDDDDEISKPFRSDFKGLLKYVVNNEANISPEVTPAITTPATPKKGRKNWDASHESPITSTPKKGRQDRDSFDESLLTSTPKKDRKSWDLPDESVIADDPFMLTLNPEERNYWELIEDAINKWMVHLTIELDNETKDRLRQQIASDIIDRQQYLQLNPEARKTPEDEFDNLLYQVHRRLNKVLGPDEMRTAIQEGDELMSMMNEVSNRTMVPNTSAEQDLHQEVKDAISDTLPILEDATSEEQDSFESIKEKLADAFIKMTYAGKQDEINKLKEKMNDDLNKFCDDYAAKHPNKPLDREKLNRELYEALKNLQFPNDIMLSTAKYVKIRDVVNDWAKRLPLEDHNATEMKSNVDDLSKKLVDLENNVDGLSSQELDNEKKNEINTFLENLPFKRGQEKNKNRFSKQLFDKLKATEKARDVNASVRYSITPDDFTMAKDRDQEPWKLPCSLTDEDVKFLERIKRRTCMAPKCLSTLVKNKAKIRPAPKSVTNDAQTEISGGIGVQTETSQLGYSSRECTKQQSFQEQKGPIRDSRSSNANVPLQPQIIIKEYYWGTNNSFDLPTECQTSSNASRGPGGPTIRPWAPPPCTERHIFPRPQPVQTSRCNPRTSIPCENDEPVQNQPFVSSGWNRACSSRDYESRLGQYSTRERTDMRSLNEFRQTYRERLPEDDGTCTINAEKGYCEDCRVEFDGERPNDKDNKPGAVVCECRPKPNSKKGRKSSKNRCLCKGTGQCSQCNGNHILCPYPSYLYFAP